ncbi:MAG: thiol reductant ABC exporter subunit CydC [Actinomycetaceae bacterium]|nr:thiol reductant ABC exporter subunit CydC [Actinomycetaceae bacterium]
MSLFVTKEEKRALKCLLPLLELNRAHFIAAIVLGVAGLSASIALGGTAAWLIARASQHPPVLFLQVATVGVRFFGISKAVLRYVQRLASHRVAMDGIAALRENVYLKLANSDTSHLHHLKRGELLARTGADVDAFGDLLVKSVLPAWVAACTGILTVGILAFFSPTSAAILGICLLISGVGAPLLTIRSARLAQLAEDRARSELAATTVTLLDHADELAVSGQRPSLRNRLDDIETQLRRAKDKAARPAALASVVDALAMGLAVGGAIIVSTGEHQVGLVSAVIVAVLVLTPLSSFEGTAELAPAAVQLVRSARAALRLEDLLYAGDTAATKPDSGLGSEPGQGEKTVAKTADSPLPAAHLKASDLAVGWPQAPVVVEGLDLEIKPGKTIGIVGPSGIGKSTLAYTLAGLLPARGGKLELGGIDYRDLPAKTVSQVVSFTPEDAHVFATSVEQNLRCARADLTPEQARELLTRAGLGQWLAHLPAGLDTVLGPGATSVSGGERRRLLLARALAAPAPIMIIDEPSEHLDAATADKLMRDLLTNYRERAVIIITHRVTPLDSADEVIVLGEAENGVSRVVRRGTHAQLLETDENYRQAHQQEGNGDEL